MKYQGGTRMGLTSTLQPADRSAAHSLGRGSGGGHHSLPFIFAAAFWRSSSSLRAASYSRGDGTARVGLERRAAFAVRLAARSRRFRRECCGKLQTRRGAVPTRAASAWRWQRLAGREERGTPPERGRLALEVGGDLGARAHCAPRGTRAQASRARAQIRRCVPQLC
jgi:hypothetical protein